MNGLFKRLTAGTGQASTRGLWVANAVFLASIAGLLAWQFWQVFGANSRAPSALRLDRATIEVPVAQIITPPARNPFDPGGTHWRTSAPSMAAPATGQILGILALPGVGVALTDRGAVHPGETLKEGELVSVAPSGAVVDAPGGHQKLELPGGRRPRLQDLNKAAPVVSGTVRQ